MRTNLPRVANELTTSSAGESKMAETKKPAWQSEELFGKVEELAQQIRLSICEACLKGYEKKDLIFLIQLLY